MNKEQIKKAITPFRIILLVAVISIIANLYFFGQKWLQTERQKYLNSGAIQLREQIFQISKQQGWVILGNSAGEQIKLQLSQ